MRIDTCRLHNMDTTPDCATDNALTLEPPGNGRTILTTDSVTGAWKCDFPKLNCPLWSPQTEGTGVCARVSYDVTKSEKDANRDNVVCQDFNLDGVMKPTIPYWANPGPNFNCSFSTHP